MVVSTKQITIPKTFSTKANSLGKKLVCFITKHVTNLLPVIATIDIQDDHEYAVISADGKEVTLTEDGICHLFQDTSSEDEIGDED